jgi:Cys-tRNA(Pro)/Cys-tRNA(Cys) deacylase
VDGKPVCLIVPSDREVSMKKVASVLNGKSSGTLPIPDAERLTGYKVGGVSPFGQKRKLPTASRVKPDGVGLRGLSVLVVIA